VTGRALTLRGMVSSAVFLLRDDRGLDVDIEVYSPDDDGIHTKIVAEQLPVSTADAIALRDMLIEHYPLQTTPAVINPAAPATTSAEGLAQRFHEAYERLAPSFGYETRPESATAWANVPDNNRSLMVAVCAEVLGAVVTTVQPAPPAVGKFVACQYAWHGSTAGRHVCCTMVAETSPEHDGPHICGCGESDALLEKG
jgi:hypothetical protein